MVINMVIHVMHSTVITLITGNEYYSLLIYYRSRSYTGTCIYITYMGLLAGVSLQEHSRFGCTFLHWSLLSVIISQGSRPPFPAFCLQVKRYVGVGDPWLQSVLDRVVDFRSPSFGMSRVSAFVLLHRLALMAHRKERNKTIQLYR